MLYRIIIGNYKSFADNTQLDMFPNPRRETFPGHVYTDGKTPVLKNCALYGANGAGKSNLIKAMLFLKKFATSFEPGKGGERLKNWYLNNRFRLPVEDETKPVTLVVEFENAGKPFLYYVEIDADGVKTEKLLLSGLGKRANQAVFERVGAEIAFKKAEVAESVRKIIDRQIEDNPAVSVLAANGTLHLTDDEDMQDAFLWFRDKLTVLETSRQIPWLIEHFKANPDLMGFVGEAFGKIGLGIESLQIRDEAFDKWLKESAGEDSRLLDMMADKGVSVSKMQDEVPLLTVTEEDGKRLVSEFVFNQMGRNGYVSGMDAQSQSTGTLRLLTLIPALYFAIHDDRTVLVDEIDNGIHPMLIKRLVMFFGDSHSKGQLIFTTHETALLNQQELLRPDEVWFVEKAEGCTKMYSLNDFKIHKNHLD